MDTSSNAKNFADEIDEIIKKNIFTYQNDPDRVTGDYRGEKGLTEAYNGRQLLELLQNADDAKTDKVLITLDTQRKILSIANNGEPFDIKGVKSLMLANTSSKNKREFIGNKGLGFRSILNWVTRVSIKTKGVTLVFSPEIARQKFEKIIPDAAIRQILIAKETDLQPGEVPFAVLAIPHVETNTNENEWTTIIEVEYRDDVKIEDNIKKQLKEIEPEILLFLNNTKEITITGSAKFDKTLKLEKPVINGEQYLHVGDVQWQLFDSGEQLLDEAKQKYYRYKIAWKQDLSDTDTRFFTYFPTQVPTGLPYLIHATFDLDPSRNQLNATDDNAFILKQIADQLGQLATTKLRNPVSNWQAFRFLQSAHTGASNLLKPFYTQLQDYINTLPIYPCVDGSYSRLDEVKFYNNEFSNWILDKGFTGIFDDLLLQVPDALPLSMPVKKYDSQAWALKINQISNNIATLSARANLISLLVQDVFKPHDKRYPLLINKDGEVIEEDILVFTPIIQAEEEFSKPGFLDFDFIDRSLYNLLVAKHKSAFEKDQPDSREFQRMFKELFNIQPYDSNNVISRIITGTRKEMAARPAESAEIIKEMVQAVFKNYKALKDKQELFTEPFPLLTIKNEVKNASDLYLSASFPTGKTIAEIYAGVLTADNFVQHIDYWELGDEDNQLSEAFFIWMRVNRFARFEPEEFEVYKDTYNAYKKYALDKIGPHEKATYYKFQGLKMINPQDTIGYLAIEKLIVLVKKEGKISERLSLSNPDKFYHTYGNAYFQPFEEKPSYISFQLSGLKKFDNYFVEDYQIPFIESFSYSSYESFFKKYDLNEEDVKIILTGLGAKGTFNDLGLTKIFELINECAQQQSNGAVARKLYRLAFDNFRKRKSGDFKKHHTSIQLRAIKNGVREYKNIDEVYYSDNNTLPLRLVEDYWIFDFPKRSGEKQIAEYFGVKTFKDIKVRIVDGSVFDNKVPVVDFSKWVEKIKPYLLTHRLNIESTATIEKASASALKSLDIKLVSEAKYQVDDNEPKKLSPGEFLNLGDNKFVICARGNSTLFNLKDDPAFCEAFAEVLCVLFEVSEGKDEYRNVFRDKDNLADTRYLITSKLLNDRLKNAIKLLGISGEESAFWKAILTLTGTPGADHITSREQLTDLLNQIDYTLPEGYAKVDFDTFDNGESFDLLKSVCGQLPNVTLGQIHQFAPMFPGLKNWHLQRVKNQIISIKSLYCKSLWSTLKNRDITWQKTFYNGKLRFSRYCDNLVCDDLDPFQFIDDYETRIIKKMPAEYIVFFDGLFIEAPPTGIYNALLNKFGLEEAVLDPENQSLLYFEGHEAYFINLFEKLKQTEALDTPMANDTIPSDLVLRFSTVTDGMAPIYKFNGAGSGGGPITSNYSKKEKNQKRAGKRAELLTRNVLQDTYDIKWISSNSDQADVVKNDGAGYDMEYKKRGTNDWFYLEVKSVSSNSFIISINEIRKALAEKEKYHLCLVKDGEINIITDFFNDENRRSTFNQLLGYSFVVPTDFEVYINFSETVNEFALTEVTEAIL